MQTVNCCVMEGFHIKNEKITQVILKWKRKTNLCYEGFYIKNNDQVTIRFVQREKLHFNAGLMDVWQSSTLGLDSENSFSFNSLWNEKVTIFA